METCVKIVQLVQIISLGISIAGTALVFYNSPFADRRVFLYDNTGINPDDKKKQNRAKWGFGLILMSYIIQTIVVFV